MTENWPLAMHAMDAAVAVSHYARDGDGEGKTGIAHEPSSVPCYMDGSLKAAVDLKP